MDKVKIIFNNKFVIRAISKEKLYEECMHLRNLTNLLKEENLKNTTKIFVLEVNKIL